MTALDSALEHGIGLKATPFLSGTLCVYEKAACNDLEAHV